MAITKLVPNFIFHVLPLQRCNCSKNFWTYFHEIKLAFLLEDFYAYNFCFQLLFCYFINTFKDFNILVPSGYFRRFQTKGVPIIFFAKFYRYQVTDVRVKWSNERQRYAIRCSIAAYLWLEVDCIKKIASTFMTCYFNLLLIANETCHSPS